MRKAFAFLFILSLVPSPAPACSLCGPFSRAVSLAYEFDQASYILYGKLANPKLNAGGLGKGTTEFHVERIIKNDPNFPRHKMVLLSQYLPILDPKDPPRYVLFYRSPTEKEPYGGRHVTSLEVANFIAELARHQKFPAEMLMFASKHLDHADPQVAEEAFLAFAKADDKVVGEVAKKLAPDRLRKLVKSADIEPERLSMFAYLLGACGDAKDADLLRELLNNPRHHKAFEGILAGYITMRPEEGWKMTFDLLKAEKASFLLRYSSLRTMRFFYNARQKETGPLVMHGLGLAIQRAEVADIAISDLKDWKRWEHTKLIVSCYDKPGHKSAIVKNSIVRYALTCPEPEAKALVERIRREDPKLLRYLEEELK